MAERTTPRTEVPIQRAQRFERWRARLSDTPESLADDAWSGLETDQFYLVYQPRMDSSDEEVRTVEALLRWQEATRGDMRPDVFLPFLADTPIMAPLGMWVLDQACAQVASWERSRPETVPAVAVAVNLAATEVLHDGFMAQVVAALDSSGVASDALQVEVDVRSQACSDPLLPGRLTELRQSGIAVTLDGISPAIANEGLPLPCDSVNLGRRHVRTIDTDPRCAYAVAAAVHTAHEQSVTVTAIGVERQSQADVLIDVGCDQLQGFYFSEPVPAADLGWIEEDPLHLPRPGPLATAGRGRPGVDAFVGTVAHPELAVRRPGAPGPSVRGGRGRRPAR